MLLYFLLALVAGSLCAAVLVVAAAMRSSQISHLADPYDAKRPPQQASCSRSELADQLIVFTAVTEVGEERTEGERPR